MTKWKVYILKCKDDSLYTGITTDLEKRLKRHNDGKASKYTRPRRPVEIAYTENIINATSARKREAEIKKLSRHDKLKMIQKNPA